MALPLSYSIRNLWTRRLTTALTASGMALVVFVFAAILMLAQGLQKTLVATGSYDNVVATRKGARTEVQSVVDRGPGRDSRDRAGDRRRRGRASGFSRRKSWSSLHCPSGIRRSGRM